MTLNERRGAIIDAVCQYYNMPLEVLSSNVKEADIARARSVMAYILYNYGNGMTFKAIGKILNRHHTTIIHFVRKAKNTFSDDITNILAAVNQGKLLLE